MQTVCAYVRAVQFQSHLLYTFRLSYCIGGHSTLWFHCNKLFSPNASSVCYHECSCSQAFSCFQHVLMCHCWEVTCFWSCIMLSRRKAGTVCAQSPIFYSPLSCFSQTKTCKELLYLHLEDAWVTVGFDSVTNAHNTKRKDLGKGWRLTGGSWATSERQATALHRRARCYCSQGLTR